MFYSQASSDSSPPSTLPTPGAGQLPPFRGYYRADGRVGTRNYWLVLPLYAGETQQLALLKEALLTSLGYNNPNPYLPQLRALREQYRAGSYFQTPIPPSERPTPMPLFANIDGVKFLSGLDWPGLDWPRVDSTGQSTPDSLATAAGIFWPMLAGYCAHPNVGGITLLCRDGATQYTDLLRACIDRCDPAFAKPLLVADRMAYPTEFDWMAAATHETFQAMTVLNRQNRQPAPLSRLTIGVRCDPTNGHSAYPAVSQYTHLLAEYGATVLMANPSLHTTLRNAAHPCAGFQSPPVGVSVFHLPGDATEITTALTAAGCTLHVSSMALARPMGNPIAPVAQLATTSARRDRPGQVTDVADKGDYLVAQTAEAILNYSLRVASGEEQTPSESRGMDDFNVYWPETDQ